jgi:uncharacterized membrane protein
MFERNESTLDRVTRGIVGAAMLAVSLVSLGLATGKPAGIAVAAVGAILLVTGVSGSCPLYRALGIHTTR